MCTGWEVSIVKNCDLRLENSVQDLGHRISVYGPPSRQITKTNIFLGRYKLKMSLRILRSGSSIRFNEDSKAFSVQGS